MDELRDMPESDLRLYQAYYQKQPFGQWRQDYNAARVAQAMAGGKLEDLMPFWHEETLDDVLDDLFAGAVSI